MKNIFLIWIIFYASLTQAAPPTSIGSEAGSKSFTQNLVLPNNQVTKLSGINSRLETGNANLLANPSFEHATFNTSWTEALGTASPETSNKTDGNQALKITSSGAGVNLYQASTINAASLKGQQMVMRVAINSTDPLLKACSRVDGVDTDCVTVPITDTNTPFKTIEIPFIAGGVSNGITIKSATTTTQNIYVDEAVVAKSSPFQNVQGAQLMGTVYTTWSTGCAWTSTSTSFANFPVDSDCNTATATGNVKAPSTKIPAVVLPAGSGAGTYYFVATGYFYTSTQVGASFRISDGINSSKSSQMFAANIPHGNVIGTINIANTIASDTTFNIQGKTQSGSIVVYNSEVHIDGFEIAVYYFPPASKIYSQATENYTNYLNAGAITIGATTTAPTKGTVVTDRVMWKRSGQNLDAIYQYQQSSTGTAGSGDYLYSLPIVNGVQLQFDTSVITPYSGSLLSTNSTSISSARVGTSAATVGVQQTNGVAIAYDATRFRIIVFGGSVFGAASNTAMWTVGSTNFTLAESAIVAHRVDINAPIEQWKNNANVIVGSFVDVPKVPGGGRVDIFSFTYGGATLGTVCSSNPCALYSKIGSGFSMGWNSTGNMTISMAKTYSSFSCKYSGYSPGNGVVYLGNLGGSCSNCSSLTIITTNSANTSFNSFGDLDCKGTY